GSTLPSERTIGTVAHCARPPTRSLTRLIHVPLLVRGNWTLSSRTKTSARASLSKKPSHGRKFGWWMATTVRDTTLRGYAPHADHPLRRRRHPSTSRDPAGPHPRIARRRRRR